MKTLWQIITVLGLILKCFLLGSILCGQEVNRFGVEITPPPRKETKSPSANYVDLRPVVEAHSLHDPKRPKVVLCVHCKEFTDWRDKHGDDYDIRFNLHEYRDWADAPEKVRQHGAPFFHWLNAATGERWDLEGWSGPENFMKSYVQVCAPPGTGLAKVALIDAPKAGENPLEMFTKFCGPCKFAVSPDKPVATFVDENTHLAYSKLAGSVKIVNGQPVITLDQPYPQISARKFGLWFKVDLLGANGQLPAAMLMNTSRGQYRIEIKEVGK